MKESKKCDSLRTAYFKQSQAFDSLVESNNIMFASFEQTRSEKIELQVLLEKKETALKKLFQKPNKGWVIPLLVGITCGIVLSASL
ncbi:hypothetical protein ACFS5M_13995 [Lacinutrix iliipiscaria]|uniref:Uncharacterized protein n=1 Tax=Lacinutrix iliipiscaria TaxID=1230532 RepID=A0ABW5WRD0_9FLAO